MNTIVAYGGRFQPPHPGHYEVYLSLLDKFSNIKIFTSNNTDITSPYTFEEKKFLWKNLFDVDIFLSSNPAFKPLEYLTDTDSLICITSEKDEARYKRGTYYIKYENQSNLLPISEKAYYYVSNMKCHNISSTHIRNLIISQDIFSLNTIYSNKITKEIFELMYNGIKNVENRRRINIKTRTGY